MRTKIRDELFGCDFCGRAETVRITSESKKAPYEWLAFNVDDKTLDMCRTCSNGLSEIFLQPGMLDELLLQIRLGHLGYDASGPAFKPELIKGICPNCLSTGDSKIKKIVERVAEYLGKITGE